MERGPAAKSLRTPRLPLPRTRKHPPWFMRRPGESRGGSSLGSCDDWWLHSGEVVPTVERGSAFSVGPVGLSVGSPTRVLARGDSWSVEFRQCIRRFLQYLRMLLVRSRPPWCSTPGRGSEQGGVRLQPPVPIIRWSVICRAGQTPLVLSIRPTLCRRRNDRSLSGTSP